MIAFQEKTPSRSSLLPVVYQPYMDVEPIKSCGFPLSVPKLIVKFSNNEIRDKMVVPLHADDWATDHEQIPIVLQESKHEILQVHGSLIIVPPPILHA
jgi:hypothetical protein